MKNQTKKAKDEINTSVNKSILNTTLADMTMEDFDDRILEINLRRPRTAYNFYITEMKEKEGGNRRITEVAQEFSKKWKKMSTKEKEKYAEQSKEDKVRYNEHVAIVRKFILAKPLREGATALTIFVDEMVEEAILTGEDPKEARAEAKEAWKNMTTKEKEPYEEKKEKHRELYEDIKDSRTQQISGYTLFCKDQFKKANEKNEKIVLKDCAELWGKTKESTKEKYDKYASEIREERQKNRDIYEIAFGVKPKRPLNAFNFYLMQMAKDGKFSTMKECSKKWKALPDDEKEKYLKIAKKAQLAYTLKKKEYNATRRKTTTKARSAFNFFMQDMKGKIPEDAPEGTLKYCYNKWKSLDDAGKKKFQKMADKDALENKKNKEEQEGKVFKKPKRPPTGYNRYVKDRVPELREKHKDKMVSELFSIIAEEWASLKDSTKDKYNKQHKEEMTAYKDKVREWEKTGCYEPDENEELDKRTKAGKSQSQTIAKEKTKNEKKENTKKGKTT
jgi:predicted RNase H-like HicB family nuclease